VETLKARPTEKNVRKFKTKSLNVHFSTKHSWKFETDEPEEQRISRKDPRDAARHANSKNSRGNRHRYRRKDGNSKATNARYYEKPKLVKKTKIFKPTPGKTFDSTLGYPGEGPPRPVEKLTVKPCISEAAHCRIDGHYHTKKRGEASGAALRHMIDRKHKPNQVIWVLCKSKRVKNCANKVHAHDVKQHTNFIKKVSIAAEIRKFAKVKEGKTIDNDEYSAFHLPPVQHETVRIPLVRPNVTSPSVSDFPGVKTEKKEREVKTEEMKLPFQPHEVADDSKPSEKKYPIPEGKHAPKEPAIKPDSGSNYPQDPVAKNQDAESSDSAASDGDSDDDADGPTDAVKNEIISKSKMDWTPVNPSKRMISKETSFVSVFSKGDLVSSTLREKISAKFAKFISTMPFVQPACSKSASSEIVQRNVTQKLFGWNFGDAKARVDVLRSAGYGTCEVLEIYVAVANYMTSWAAPVTQAVGENGKVRNNLSSSLRACFKSQHPLFMDWVGTHPVRNQIMENTTRYAQNIRFKNDYRTSYDGSKAIAYRDSAQPANTRNSNDIYRILGLDSAGAFDFHFNQKFKCMGPGWVKTGGQLCSEYYSDWTSKLTTNYYVSCFGPHIPSDACTHQSSFENINSMLMRLLSVPDPAHPEKLAESFRNQRKTFGSGKMWCDEWELVSECISREARDDEQNRDTAVDYATERKAVYKKVNDEIRNFGPYYQKIVRNTLKKKNEIAKAGKKARTYASLGVASTLDGSAPIRDLKNGVAQHPLKIPRKAFKDGNDRPPAEITFVPKPSFRSMTEWARSACDLSTDDIKTRAWVHSDDAMLKIFDRKKQLWFRFNIDIKSCDASHSPHVFKGFAKFFQYDYRLYKRLIAHILKPLGIMGPDKHDLPSWLIPLMPYLPSGHVFTTLINTYAMMSIMRQCVIDEVTSVEEIEKSAWKLGYIVTVDEVFKDTDCQFLKHSPVHTPDGIFAVKNIGVLFRAIGKCLGDMVGEGEWKIRAKLYAFNVLSSYSHGVSNPFLNHWKDKFRPKKPGSRLARIIRNKVASDFEYKVDLLNETIIEVSDFELFERYSLEEDALRTTLEELLALGVGEGYHDTVTHKILFMDYGLGPPGEVVSVGTDPRGIG
jgi:hypothetical protein